MIAVKWCNGNFWLNKLTVDGEWLQDVCPECKSDACLHQNLDYIYFIIIWFCSLEVRI